MLFNISNCKNLFFQSWRAVELEPTIPESAPIEDWHEIGLQDAPKRRRPGRKRKRRPPIEDDSIRDETKTEIEDVMYEPQQETESHVVYETTELPRRRRKRPEMRNNRWNEEIIENQRPTRRRGQRRKRPMDRDSEEEINMFSVVGSELRHRPLQNSDQETEEDIINNNESRHRIRPTESKSLRVENDKKKIKKKNNILSIRPFEIQEEKSLSELSDEDQPRDTLSINTTLSNRDKELNSQVNNTYTKGFNYCYGLK